MQKTLSPLVSFYNGNKIPQIGYGTYQLVGEPCIQGTVAALKYGYRHIDSASIYRNSKDIRAALLQCPEIPRTDIFITSKIAPGEQGYDNTIASCKRLIDELGCGYLDLLLIHWPGVAGVKPEDIKNSEIRLETYRALEDLLAQNLIRNIGVSNFLKRHLEHLLANVKVKPVLNQIEVHPLGWDIPTVQYCEAQCIIYCTIIEILVQAYSPLARQSPALLENPKLLQLASLHKKSIAQISLRWGLQKNFIVIPKSKSEQYIRENFDIMDFNLSAEEMKAIDSLNVGLRTCWDPEKVKI